MIQAHSGDRTRTQLFQCSSGVKGSSGSLTAGTGRQSGEGAVYWSWVDSPEVMGWATGQMG
ncbi:MAG: hypothetical protein HC772_16935 [Leptolyngbyaceae cyanobacterium CRU_2_3]|nr:hypothetical protein [Leptolyngbyaceae cyanobacterium CRU_2_3]